MNRSESNNSFSELKLTKTESFHAEKRATTPESEKAKIQLFQQNPKNREMVINDPFGAEAKLLIQDLPGPENTYSVLRTAILTEPDGAYENEFNKINSAEKQKKLYDQIDSSAEMTVRIEKYIQENTENIDKMTEDELYKNLSRVAFGTLKEEEIQKKYALSQRRGFRLGITNFLEDKNKLFKYKKEAIDDPQAFAEKYLKKTFKGKVVIEQLPIGLVIYLDESDYALFGSKNKTPEEINSSGIFISYSSLAEDLRGKIIIINKGGPISGQMKLEEIEDIKKHETKHLIYKNFHQQTDMPEKIFDITETSSKDDIFWMAKIDSEFFIEKAKDEIIAYFSVGRLNEDDNALGLGLYEKITTDFKNKLEQNQEHIFFGSDSGTPLHYGPRIDNDQKKEIIKEIDKYKNHTINTIKKIRFVAEKLYHQPNNSMIEKIFIKVGITKNKSEKNDISEALLRNTPGNKIHRLARYIGLDENDIKSLK